MPSGSRVRRCTVKDASLAQLTLTVPREATCSLVALQPAALYTLALSCETGFMTMISPLENAGGGLPMLTY